MTAERERRFLAALDPSRPDMVKHATSLIADDLQLDEDERKQARDLLAELLPDEDGIPQYHAADHIWMALHKAGFDITRRVAVAEHKQHRNPR